MREYRKRKMAEDPERVLAAERAQHWKHRDKNVQRSREYYRKNKAEQNAKNNANYYANREAAAARAKVYREANAAKLAADKAAYYRANKEARAEYARKYRQANKVKVQAQQREWYATERGKLGKAAVEAKRRGVPYTDDALEYLQIIKADPCSYCGGPGGTVDHIDPISTGGSGDWDNLAGACKPCNSAKGTRSLLAFLMRY
jgi:5-methylcytosine-specific restriction endonuclease McrA